MQNINHNILYFEANPGIAWVFRNQRNVARFKSSFYRTNQFSIILHSLLSFIPPIVIYVYFLGAQGSTTAASFWIKTAQVLTNGEQATWPWNTCASQVRMKVRRCCGILNPAFVAKFTIKRFSMSSEPARTISINHGVKSLKHGLIRVHGLKSE